MASVPTQMQVCEYDTDFASQLIYEEGQASVDEYNEVVDGLSETSIVNRGRSFNEFMVNFWEVFYNYNEETGQVDTTFGDMRRYNPRQNQYFKPIVTVRDVWSLSDKSTLTTTAYASFGSGGGEGIGQHPRQLASTTARWTCKARGMRTSCLNLGPTDSTWMKTASAKAPTSFALPTTTTVGLGPCPISTRR